MDATDILNVSVLTTGKFYEPPSPAFPAGRFLVARRATLEYANYTLPSGQTLAVYLWFIPANPRTPRQQANRRRLNTAMQLLRDGYPTPAGRIAAIMQERRIPEWHAKMRWLLTESGAL